MDGTLLSSFSTGHDFNFALAWDPADGTLWLSNDDFASPNYRHLEQYSETGALLSVGSFMGGVGAEFDEAPEPSSIALLGTGVSLLLSQYRRVWAQ